MVGLSELAEAGWMLGVMLILPWLAALLWGLRPDLVSLGWLTSSIALVILLLVVLLPLGVEAESSWLLLGAAWKLDQLGWMFLSFTALLWLVASGYLDRWIIVSSRRFGVLYLITMGGSFGSLLAQDVFTFYFSYAAMSLAAYGIIVPDSSAGARRAGSVYMALTISAEVLLFVALVLQAQHSGSVALAGLFAERPSNLVILLILLSFGVKAGLFPLHVSLPLIYRSAPVPAQIVLAGALLHVGLFGWLRFLPIGYWQLPFWGSFLVILGMVAVLYAVIVGLTQREPESLLAYSSISQIGLMTVGLGIGLSHPGLAGFVVATITLYAVHHGFAKGSLFLGMGLFRSGGLRRGVALVALLIPALALVGAPWTSGALAKGLLKETTSVVPSFWEGGLSLALSGASVGTALLMIRLFFLIFLGRSTKELPTDGWLGLAVLIGATLGGTWLVAWAWQLDMSLGKPTWGNMVPLAGAVLLGALAWRLRRHATWLTQMRIPAGDILVLLEHLTRLWPRKYPSWPPLLGESLRARVTVIRNEIAELGSTGRAMEIGMRQWSTAGTVIVFLLGIFLALMLVF